MEKKTHDKALNRPEDSYTKADWDKKVKNTNWEKFHETFQEEKAMYGITDELKKSALFKIYKEQEE